MADQQTALNTSFEYSIRSISLYTSDGNVVDLRGVMLSLDIYEDLFSACMKGSISISDGQDLLSTFKIHGNEFIEIELEKPTLDIPYKQSFRVYRVSDKTFVNNSQNFTLYFTSEEFVLSSQIILSKSYRGMTTSQIIEDIAKNQLKISQKKTLPGWLEQIPNPMDVIIPRMHPLEAIYWLLSRSFGVDNSLYFFYETRDGYFLRSFENLIKSQQPYSKYYYNDKTNSEPDQNINAFTFLNVIEDFDILKASRFGTFSSTLLNLDIVSKSFNALRHSSFQEKKSGLLNKELPLNDFKNRLDKSIYDCYEGMVKYTITNDSDNSTNPIQPEQWMMRTASKYGQLQMYKMIGSIPGDPLVKAGMIVEVELPVVNPQEKQNVEINSIRSGRYLVSAVHHSYKKNIHSTVLELVSDSVNDYMNSPSSNPKLKELKEA